jgi:hypothetical protein
MLKIVENPNWMIAMHEEVNFIQENWTLTLVDLPP